MREIQRGRGPGTAPRQPLVHLVDNDAKTHRLVGEVLGRAGYEVSCHFDPEEFLSGFQPYPPQCLILDLFLPLMSGLELQRRLVTQYSGLPIILMTGNASAWSVVQAMRQGAADFLEKPCRPEELLDAVGRAVKKDRERCREAQQGNLACERLSALSAREHEVFRLIARGHSSKSAAALLHIAKKTVDFHRGNLMRKLGADSLAEIVRLAIMLDGQAAAGQATRAETSERTEP